MISPANIEVLIMIKAFGAEQTLGNVLFAVTFLITDILSECEGKKAADKAVYTSFFASIFFLVLSQSWLHYVPSESDWASPAIRTIFSNTPRMIIASLAVYGISQLFDVWLYHKIWDMTSKKSGNRRPFLWLRNNGSTLVSQLISIFISSYVIYIFTSLLDTPVVYLARRVSDKRKTAENQ